jgi:hypothetical protein
MDFGSRKGDHQFCAHANFGQLEHLGRSPLSGDDTSFPEYREGEKSSPWLLKVATIVSY